MLFHGFDPHVDPANCQIWNHVQRSPTADSPGIISNLWIGVEIGNLIDQPGSGDDRVSSFLKFPSCVSGFATNDERKISRALSPRNQCSVGQRRFVQQAEIAARGDLLDDTNTSRRSDFFVGVEQNFPADLSSQRTGFECFKRGEHYNDPTFGIGHAGPIDRTVVKRFAFLERMPNRVHSVHVNAQQDFLARLRPLADVNHLPQLLLDLGTTVVDDRHRLGVDQFDLATERFKLVNQTLLDCRKPFKIERPGVYVAKALDQLQHRGALVVDRFKMLQQVSQFILSRLRLSFSFSSFAEAAENSILN